MVIGIVLSNICIVSEGVHARPDDLGYTLPTRRNDFQLPHISFYKNPEIKKESANACEYLSATDCIEWFLQVQHSERPSQRKRLVLR